MVCRRRFARTRSLPRGRCDSSCTRRPPCVSLRRRISGHLLLATRRLSPVDRRTSPNMPHSARTHRWCHTAWRGGDFGLGFHFSFRRRRLRLLLLLFRPWFSGFALLHNSLALLSGSRWFLSLLALLCRDGVGSGLGSGRGFRLHSHVVIFAFFVFVEFDDSAAPCASVSPPAMARHLQHLFLLLLLFAHLLVLCDGGVGGRGWCQALRGGRRRRRRRLLGGCLREHRHHVRLSSFPGGGRLGAPATCGLRGRRRGRSPRCCPRRLGNGLEAGKGTRALGFRLDLRLSGYGGGGGLTRGGGGGGGG